MATTPEKKPTFTQSVDPLYDWARERDPLRYRHGLSRAEYGQAFHFFGRARRTISDRVLNVLAAFIVGAALGILLAWRG